MKKIMCIIACIMTLTLAGCSSSYERDENPGQVEVLTVKEMQEKIDNKESFAIIFTQTTCTHCVAFHKMLDSYILYHNITLYEVVLDEAPASERKDNLAQIRKTFKGLEDTPSLYYVNEGKEEDSIIGSIDEDTFDSWVVKHQLDKLEKE